MLRPVSGRSYRSSGRMPRSSAGPSARAVIIIEHGVMWSQTSQRSSRYLPVRSTIVTPSASRSLGCRTTASPAASPDWTSAWKALR